MRNVCDSRMLNAWAVLAVWLGMAAAADAQSISRVFPNDARLKPHRTYNDAYHPWTPPATKEAWEQEAQRLREQVLVSTGLWPMPPAAPLQPVIHGKIERDDYTVEKVFFAGHPGFYITGNLYRPKQVNGKVPGVLCPHGHWKNGRFYDSGDDGAKAQIAEGAEKFNSGAHFPLQARMVHLARLGCVVFHYDMVGYADSLQMEHRSGFSDVQAELWLQNYMGLQTFHSIRALDFIQSLPEVDPARIGVTGASGGGTQTFTLCAIDPRPAVAFPAVMVSTGMQGGCVCENASYLRIGTNNIALSALFAPKPQAMSGADDWTIEIETKGYPELKHIYGLYGKPDFVLAKTYPQFKHNYNQVAREMMYAWFNQHLNLGRTGPIIERDFEPIQPKDLSVFDAEHPRPADALTLEQLRQNLAHVSADQFAALVPKDAAGVAAYRKLIGTAVGVMLDRGLPAADELQAKEIGEQQLGKIKVLKVVVGRKQGGEAIPVVALVPPNFDGTAVLWIDGKGKSALFDAADKPVGGVQKLLDAGLAVVSADVFLTGEFLTAGQTADPKVNSSFAGYTFGYNRPLLAERVRDVLTVLAGTLKDDKVKSVHLIGTGGAGPWVLLARALTGDRVQKTVVDLEGFGFSKIDKTSDVNLLPGALKYGGIGGLAALAAPGDVTIVGTEGTPAEELHPLREVYRLSNGKLQLEPAGFGENPSRAAELVLAR